MQCTLSCRVSAQVPSTIPLAAQSSAGTDHCQDAAWNRGDFWIAAHAHLVPSRAISGHWEGQPENA